MKTLRPVNQKSVYQSAGELYQKILDGEIHEQTAVLALKALSIMNKTYGFECKRYELEQVTELNHLSAKMRIVEIKNFDQLPIEE